MEQIVCITMSVEEFQALVKDAVQAGVREVLSDEPKRLNELNQPEYHSRAEVAKRLGVSLGTINNRVRDGVIKTVRLGGRVLIHASELERLRFELERKIRA